MDHQKLRNNSCGAFFFVRRFERQTVHVRRFANGGVARTYNRIHDSETVGSPMDHQKHRSKSCGVFSFVQRRFERQLHKEKPREKKQRSILVVY